MKKAKLCSIFILSTIFLSLQVSSQLQAETEIKAKAKTQAKTQADIQKPFKNVKLPNAKWEWTQDKNLAVEKAMNLKSAGAMVTISFKLVGPAPMTAEAFADLTRKVLIGQKQEIYTGANFGEVKKEKIGQYEWSYFKIIAKGGQLNQEMWLRKFGEDKIYMSLYTAIGDNYSKNLADFQAVMKQISN